MWNQICYDDIKARKQKILVQKSFAYHVAFWLECDLGIIESLPIHMPRQFLKYMARCANPRNSRILHFCVIFVSYEANFLTLNIFRKSLNVQNDLKFLSDLCFVIIDTRSILPKFNSSFLKNFQNTTFLRWIRAVKNSFTVQSYEELGMFFF